ncbi:conserved hypothetical protein [Talaromyces stipitatus ATCC 10500]|uniref:Capsule polysaccharide biosynthesis protein n=1 Tax=Talaromyces stipitatus (strain ATCC 10500 / CBS 375.48 / QM 6759 / NRRL 1006) TaxID=441959 RepID=B8M658_TALSN|nr:uncharacterized protein TSTA_023910 [Talaromyces stipitatus ATCC 10500]EED19058.1 conserved hypothetical protein [Talaromyces stipitatus ATCC 10500]
MTAPKYEIPKEFKNQLRFVESADSRSDDEIVASLRKAAPLNSSEKNIWAFWDSGLDSMPAWTRRNVINWARLCGPSWTIRILDAVPNSPNHALNYVPPAMLPEAFVKGTLKGPYTGPHSADFLRGALPYLYGGVFIDVGIILIRSLDKICWDILSDPSKPQQVSVPWMYGTVMANHFVAARQHDPFIKRWHDLFVYLWSGKNSHEGLSANPLVAFAQKLDFSASQRRGFAWDFQVGPGVVFEYITQVIAWLRLCMLEEAGDGFSCADYAQNNILWFDSMEEDWAAEKFFEALTTRLDDDPESERYKKAYELIWRLLTKSSMQKITHGKNLTKTPALGILLDKPENVNKDIEEGTFADLLRYGSVHFEQTRSQIAVVKIEKPVETMKKGVFEP